MDIITGFLIIIGIYLWFFFIDRFLKSCSHYAYLQFLKGTGIEIKILQFKWTTTALNRTLIKWGSSKPKLLNAWFNIGVFFSLTLLPIGIFLLFVAFSQNFAAPGGSASLIIEPMLPGVNLPASEIGYYSATLLMSSLIHELGHALAAVQEDVTLLNVGVNVIFVLPVAYVNLNGDKLFSLNPWKRLKILCAGVWHNLFIALLAYLLYISLPWVFSPLYSTGEGVVVSEITPRSPLGGPKGLNYGDKITNINDCPATDEDAWDECLRALQIIKPAFCIKSDLVHNLDESVHLKHVDGAVTCCQKDNGGKLCFEYLVHEDSILELPPYACLPGRTVIETSTHFCTKSPHDCPKESYCFRPALTNGTNLYKIKRVGQNDVIFVGPVSDLVRTLTLSSYTPKHAFLTTAFPDCVTKFLGYVVVFSTGLAVVNILPCLFMDGQHIMNTLSHLAFSRHLRPTHIQIVSAVTTVCFTCFLVLHCVITIWRKFNF